MSTGAAAIAPGCQDAWVTGNDGRELDLSGPREDGAASRGRGADERGLHLRSRRPAVADAPRLPRQYHSGGSTPLKKQLCT